MQNWQSEIDTYLSGLLTGIIVKPYDVNKLLKELTESMPHYLWWNEKTQLIELTALKAPAANADVLDMDQNLIKLSTTDKPEMRSSTILVNFGQFDPTKKLDEPNNYQQSYARVDTGSIAKYSSNDIKTINSRWISNTNKAAALQLAALIGRRFSNVPREVSFSLDAKDSAVWVGQSREINHRDITDFSGLSKNTVFQILSAKESRTYDYQALEFLYGDALTEDEGGGELGVDLVVLGSDDKNIDLRSIYNGLFTTPDSSTQVKFIIEAGVVIGSSSISTYALETGNWPSGAIVTLKINSGAYVVGKGGTGGTPMGNGETGGNAILLDHNLTLTNNGVIGGGGGGGGGATSTEPGTAGMVNGGGGAGYDVGFGHGGADNGTLENGGAGETTQSVTASSGSGGDLGQSGSIGIGNTTTSAGAAGDAIDKNGFTLTQTISGSDIRGAIA